MATLSVNIDHIATIREARKSQEPDPIHAALLAELAGAHGITCHLREDRRHINDRDLSLLKQTVKSRINLEMAPTSEMIEIAIKTKPHSVTLVPEKREELTTEGGLNVHELKDTLSEKVNKLQKQNILVSLFIDPQMIQIKASSKINADYIELHTGSYANSEGILKAEELEKIKNMALAANKLGLGVNAGHGLDYYNTPYVSSIDYIEELNIGHSIIARAALVGIEKAVRDMLNIIS